MMKKIFRHVFNRIFIVAALILIQLITLIMVIWKFSNNFVYFYAICALVSIIVVMWIVNGRSNPSYKIAWIIPIMVFPIFGVLLYLFFSSYKVSKRTKKMIYSMADIMSRYLHFDKELLEELEVNNAQAANQSRYIEKYALCPVYTNTTTQYLPIGEKKFEYLMDELKKAKRYIFLEYFIIEEGNMWNAILSVLVEKVKQGVEVRVIYDDIGCLTTLPFGYDKKLENLGIKCCVFNPFVPMLSIHQNNRDHRKIAVIDGHTAFTGGINLADEYINCYEKHGHWKDTSIVIYGEAAWSFTVMFLSMWEQLRKFNENYEDYKPTAQEKKLFRTDGYVQPFSDNPLNNESVGESVYLNLIGAASRYIYINTPYLVIDNEMRTALCLAAKKGVEVRVVTPHVPDKVYVHAVSRSNYETLIESGVHIYEYTPGFIHAKTFVVDDMYAVVGTINLDYRSLFLHFECGVWLYCTQSVLEVKKDYCETLELCEEIKLHDCKSVKWYIKLIRSILNLFSPLM